MIMLECMHRRSTSSRLFNLLYDKLFSRGELTINSPGEELSCVGVR